MTDHNQTPTTAQVRRNQLPLPNGDSREVNLAEFDRWLAELTERVRAEQRETDARIGHDAAAEWVDGWQPNSHKNSRIEDCIAAAIREAGKQ